MKTKEEVKDYLDNHFFQNRRFAYPIRDHLANIPKYKGVEFNIQWESAKSGSKSKNIITSDDVIRFIYNLK